ncbi:MAG TPA: DUF5915 domain-containing protein, partial [Prolixibacteraceae bacterium]|nr:DUF5915 domain-containing protein [Prolixibacteraceae bacterium]
PIAPFYMDLLYTDLNSVTRRESDQSVHISDFPVFDPAHIDKELEEKMELAQKISSMVLGLRRKEKLKVRQPLAKIMIPVLTKSFGKQLKAVENIILTEVNVKDMVYLTDTSGIIKKKIKPDFKILGPRYGKQMKEISAALASMQQDEITAFEQNGFHHITAGKERITLVRGDVEILSEDIPGWLVATEGNVTVALDIQVTEDLRNEGIAREFINRIQNLRKESDFDVTDKIRIRIAKHELVNEALKIHQGYIANQVLASSFVLVDEIADETARKIDIDDVEIFVSIQKDEV